MEIKKRSGFVSIVGAPNAGKSTLLNTLIGQKLSIVTHKVQTTRTSVKGILIENHSQIIFIDTPGIFQANKNLEVAIVSAAMNGIKDADVVLFIVDCTKGLNNEILFVIEKLKNIKIPVILVINKIDLINKEKLLFLIDLYKDKISFKEIFMISAVKKNGIEPLTKWLSLNIPISEWLFPEDQLTDIPVKQLASEFTREVIFKYIHQEIPYSLSVENETWEEKKDRSIKIDQIIFVETENQRKILLGQSGAKIKEISIQARHEIGKFLGVKVHLFLFIKVRKNWLSDPERYHAMGLEYIKK